MAHFISPRLAARFRLPLLAAIAITLAVPGLAPAQPVSRQDPLGAGRLVMPSHEIVSLLSRRGSSDFDVEARVYDSTGPLDSADLVNAGRSYNLGQMGGGRDADLAVGNFSSDGEATPRPEWIYAFEGRNRNVVVSSPLINATLFPSYSANQIAYSAIFDARSTPYQKLPGVSYAPNLRVIRTQAGDVDGDGLDEFVLGARDSAGQIRVFIYDVAGSALDPEGLDLSIDYEPIAHTSYRFSGISCSTSLPYAPAGSPQFELAVVDVDRDGIDEIVIGDFDASCNASGTNGTDRWSVQPRVTVYDHDVNDTNWVGRGSVLVGPIKRADRRRPTGVWTGSTWSRIALDAGDLDLDGAPEIALAYGSDRGQAEFATLRFDFDPSAPLGGADFEASDVTVLRSSNPECNCDKGPFSLDVADVDGEGRAEVLLHTDGTLWLLAGQDGLALAEIATADVQPSYASDSSHRTIVVADADLEYGGTVAREILVAERIDPTAVGGPATLARFRWDGVDGLDRIGEQLMSTAVGSGFNPGRVALRALNLDDDGANLSNPECATVEDVVQPLVVLNAPPIHFDADDRAPADGSCFDASGAVLPGCFDVNYCYPNDETTSCDFQATYRLEESTEVTSEIRSDWATSSSTTVASGLTVETPYVSAAVDASLTRAVGERFESNSEEGTTITTQIDVTAVRNDLVLVTEGAYEVCEYDVTVDASPNPIGNVIVAMPEVLQTRWRNPAQFPSDALLVSGHESGNLLSYRLLSPLEANDPERLPEVARALAVFDVVPLDASGSSFGFRVDFSEFEEDALSFESRQSFATSLTASATAGASNPFVGVTASIGVNVSGNYDSGEMSTHRTRIATSQSFEVELGQLDGSVQAGGGSPAYDVQPYVYWNQNGSLVLDYSVDIDLPGSFWRNRYGFGTDLSFHLPWRHDRAKGIASTPIESTERSPDISLSSPALDVGESFDLSVRVQNYSLALAAPIPTPVRLYFGDPRNGGIEIETDGSGIVAPDPRDSEVVTFTGLTLPAPGIVADPRIFVELDPDDVVAEIHENNNLAWKEFVFVPEPGFGIGLMAGALGLLAARGRPGRRGGEG